MPKANYSEQETPYNWQEVRALIAPVIGCDDPEDIDKFFILGYGHDGTIMTGSNEPHVTCTIDMLLKAVSYIAGSAIDEK